MSIALEPVNPIPDIEEVPIQQEIVEAEEPVEPEEPAAAAVELSPPLELAEPAVVAVVKRRGRPPKAAIEAPPPKAKAPAKPKAPPKPKAPTKAPKPPPPEDSSSEDVDETLRNVYNHVARPDLETAVLQFLVNRRQNEAQRRRTLWSQLAQM